MLIVGAIEQTDSDGCRPDVAPLQDRSTEHHISSQRAEHILAR